MDTTITMDKMVKNDRMKLGKIMFNLICFTKRKLFVYAFILPS